MVYWETGEHQSDRRPAAGKERDTHMDIKRILAAVDHTLAMLPVQLHHPLPAPLREKYLLCTLRYA